MASPTAASGRARANEEVLEERPTSTTLDSDPSNHPPPPPWQHVAAPLDRVLADIAQRSGFDVDGEP